MIQKIYSFRLKVKNTPAKYKKVYCLVTIHCTCTYAFKNYNRTFFRTILQHMSTNMKSCKSVEWARLRFAAVTHFPNNFFVRHPEMKNATRNKILKFEYKVIYVWGRGFRTPFRGDIIYYFFVREVIQKQNQDLYPETKTLWKKITKIVFLSKKLWFIFKNC